MRCAPCISRSAREPASRSRTQSRSTGRSARRARTCRARAAFERERRPVVEKLLAAANASSYWYERFPEKMREPPWRLAYDYMTRSGRMTDDRLREQSPKFMANVEAQRRGGR